MGLRPALAQALLAVGMSMGVSAHACRMMQPLEASDYTRASLVVEAEVVGLRPTVKRLSPSVEDAVGPTETVVGVDLQLRVAKVVRGELESVVADSDTFWAGWIHGTFGHPATLAEFDEGWGRHVRVGLVMPHPRDGTSPSYTSDHAGAPSSKPYVLNRLCSGPYILPIDSDGDGMAEG